MTARGAAKLFRATSKVDLGQKPVSKKSVEPLEDDLPLQCSCAIRSVTL